MQHGTCDKDEQSELSEKQWYNHTHTVAAAFCNQFNLWGASHMSVCQSSLRKLNGAHFICNWMQIKISLLRGLKSWKGRLHAVNLRIWIMLEYAVPFYSLFLSSATPAKWINQSLPSSWKVKGKDSTTADEEHLSHSQSVDWSCSVQNLKGRDVSSSTELGAGRASLRPCVLLGRQPATSSVAEEKPWICPWIQLWRRRQYREIPFLCSMWGWAPRRIYPTSLVPWATKCLA